MPGSRVLDSENERNKHKNDRKITPVVQQDCLKRYSVRNRSQAQEISSSGSDADDSTRFSDADDDSEVGDGRERQRRSEGWSEERGKRGVCEHVSITTVF